MTRSEATSTVNRMLLRHVIGAALRRIRLEAGRTLREVALTANISMPYLSEIERGRKEPSSEVLAGICAALGLSIVDLLHEAAFELQGAEALVVDLTAHDAPVTAIASVHLASGHVASVHVASGHVGAIRDGGVQLAVAA